MTDDRGLAALAERLADEFIHVRGAHNPTADELEYDEEVRPCAWCRLAGEQAAEAITRLGDSGRFSPDGGLDALERDRLRTEVAALHVVPLGGFNLYTDPYEAFLHGVARTKEAVAASIDGEPVMTLATPKEEQG